MGVTTVDLAFAAAGDGEPVLILHGLFGAGSNWRGIARELARRRRVISVDLRNHGASPWAGTMSYLEMAADVRALIERERLGAPAVVGHSMGGKTAMALALLHPEAVGRLVVVDIAPVDYGDELSGYVQAMRAVDVAAAPSRGEVERQLAQTIAERGVVAFLLTNLVLRDGQARWRLNLDAIAAAMPEVRGFPAELRGRRYDGPTQSIAGDRSDYVLPTHLDAFKALFPRLGTIRIGDAGHWVHADQPHEFLRAVERALDAPP